MQLTSSYFYTFPLMLLYKSLVTEIWSYGDKLRELHTPQVSFPFGETKYEICKVVFIGFDRDIGLKL